MTDVDPYTIAWVGWGAAFFVIEGKAIYDGYKGKSGETLSEHLRDWLGTDKTSTKRHRILGVTAFALFGLWFFPHILFGGS